MPMFLVTLRPARPEMLTEGPTQEEASAVSAHFQYLVRLHEQGALKLAGRTQDDGPETVGLAFLNAPDLAAAQALVDADPAVVAGVFRAKLQPYAIAVGG
ncbi:MAG: YciI family protein [Armatimonadota bacterium]